MRRDYYFAAGLSSHLVLKRRARADLARAASSAERHRAMKRDLGEKTSHFVGSEPLRR